MGDTFSTHLDPTILAGKMRDHVTSRGGRHLDDEGKSSINGAWTLMIQGADTIDSLEKRVLDLEMSAGALQAIQELLDNGSIPRGTFADDQVRNLVAMYNQQKARVDVVTTALMDIKTARLRYAATGFPMGLHPEPADWMENRAHVGLFGGEMPACPPSKSPHVARRRRRLLSFVDNIKSVCLNVSLILFILFFVDLFLGEKYKNDLDAGIVLLIVFAIFFWLEKIVKNNGS